MRNDELEEIASIFSRYVRGCSFTKPNDRKWSMRKTAANGITVHHTSDPGGYVRALKRPAGRTVIQQEAQKRMT